MDVNLKRRRTRARARERAIQDIEDARATHVLKVVILRADPAVRDRVLTAQQGHDIGDERFHEDWVERYDNVLRVLRG